jgi:hypothetical protein
MKSTLAVLRVLVPMLSAGCALERTAPASAPTTTSGVIATGPVTARDAELVASERCDREARCDNIGAHRKYPTREVCVAMVRDDSLNTLTKAACPEGVDSARLQTCLMDIREDRCNNPFDALSPHSAAIRRALGACSAQTWPPMSAATSADRDRRR